MKYPYCPVFIICWLSIVSVAQQGTVMLPPSPSNLPSTEIETLQRLYDSTDGLNWIWRNNSVHWNFSGNPNPCSEDWYGVHCTTIASGGYLHVRELILVALNLVGTLPKELGQLKQLTSLDLSVNRLSGSVPSELGNITQLEYLGLNVNHLTGTLTPELCSLTQLLILNLRSNHLTGTLPPHLGNLTRLLKLALDTNHLTGTIQSELSDLSQLWTLELDTNHLSGTLPPGLGNLPLLLHFHLFSNYLTGTLPPELGKLVKLLDLGLYLNQLTGTVPPELGALTQLLYFYLFDNHLTGTLPPELSSLAQLQSLNVDTNYLTGTLPPELGNLAQLLDFDLDTNLLIGTLPPELGNALQMVNLNLSGNFMTGTLPSELSSLSQLCYFDVANNHFAGTFPLELHSETWANITAMNLASNFLTGTISDSLFQFPLLQYLDVSRNFLTGTLSSNLHRAKELLYLSVAYNQVWGCLPRIGFALQEIDVTNNLLRCSLVGAFNSENGSASLINVQLGDNQFTGTLPAVLFSLPKLQTLVAVSNCFTGTLPQEICQATALRSLILDGVGAARSCPTVWTTWQREGQLRIPNRFHGSIPVCVYSLPALTSLHLSGNNLIGSIPDSVALGGNLTQLYLSHNVLTGTIPEAVQTHSWSQLDLSYNRFSGSLLPIFGVGTLQGPFNATASVVVNNSRLSGEIPATVLQLPQVSMLGSNMFSCKTDKSDVPNTDGNDDKQRYQCGSDSFNYAFYLFLSLTGAAVSALIFLWLGPVQGILPYLNRWQLPSSSFPVSCQDIFSMMRVLTQVGVFCCVPLLLVLVPWYTAASHYYGTYTHQYAWVVSAAFLSGLAPGLVEFFLWTTLIFLAARVAYQWSSSSSTKSAAQQEESCQSNGTISLADRVQSYSLFLGVNLAVVVGVNVAFVYVSLNESSEAVLLAQVALSLFKVGWNTAGVPYLLEWISKRLMPVKGSSGFFRVQTFIGLFNNIAIPCLVVAAESPSCFRDLLFPPADVTSEFSVQICQLVNSGEQSLTVQCTDPSLYPQQSSFAPQFSYSYECSSSFITYYSAAMVYFALTAAVLVPAVRLLLCWLVNNSPTDSKIHQWITATLPKLWRVPKQSGDSGVQSSRRGGYVHVDNLLVNMTVYLGILLTFGVVFPPVALAMCVAMLSTAYQTRLAVGRLLFNAREVGAQHVVEAVEQDCRGMASLEKLQSVIVMAIVFACYFYALFIFDTIGDAEGFAGACWVLALWAVGPVCFAAYSRTQRILSGRSVAEDGKEIRPSSVELGVVHEHSGVVSAAVKADVGLEKGHRKADEEEIMSALHA